MLQTITVKKAVTKNGGEDPGVVAVAHDPSEILLRWTGKQNFGKEDALCYISKKDGCVVFKPGIAEKYGLNVKYEEGINLGRIRDILISYIDNDFNGAEPEYVRETLVDHCGCTVSELKSLGIYDWLWPYEDEGE